MSGIELQMRTGGEWREIGRKEGAADMRERAAKVANEWAKNLPAFAEFAAAVRTLPLDTGHRTMTDQPIPEAYRSKAPEQAMAHLGEELAEALTAVLKSLRFGFDSVNPELPASEQETNAEWLRREMKDVERAYEALKDMACMSGYDGWYCDD